MRLLDELGRIALLTHAFRRIDALPPGLQADVRQMLGWSLALEEVAAGGEAVSDRWLVAGQWVEDDEKVRVRRTWLAGAKTSRTALILHFSAGGAPFAENLVPGTSFDAELVYWPSAAPQRAMIRTRTGGADAFSGRLPGFDALDAFLGSVAAATAHQPWLDRTLACLRSVTPVHLGKPGRAIRDGHGDELRLAPVDSWSLFAISGGHALDLVAEWDGHELAPLGALQGGVYHLLRKSA